MEAGSMSAEDRARDYVDRVLAEHYPGHVPADADQAIRERFPIKLPVEAIRGGSA